ncbi:MAG TPA: ADP-ribosylglycohydrolase family protein [Polyangiaceae bacterium]
MQTAVSQSRFVGCLLGLALGDALGAPFEGGPIERALWKLIGKTREGRYRWTDDTQMALDLAESLTLKPHLDQDDLALRFARGYRWSRGYGPGAARILKQIRRGVDWRVANTATFRLGSFGNGAAMRAPVIGLVCVRQPSALVARAKASAFVTHAHPLGQEGAILVALATSLACADNRPTEILDGLQSHAEQEEFVKRLELARIWLGSANVDTDIVRRRLGNGVAAAESCVTAIYIALRFLGSPFDELLAFTAACKGDVDTIGAMAGAIWGAHNGAEALPVKSISRLERSDHIQDVAIALYEATMKSETA